MVIIAPHLKEIINGLQTIHLQDTTKSLIANNNFEICSLEFLCKIVYSTINNERN
jgi:hypothetical protein